MVMKRLQSRIRIAVSQLSAEPGYTVFQEPPSPTHLGKRRKKLLKEEAQFKSKWDQFCDFTSLVGFRLLSSKFPLTLRIPTALSMLVCLGALMYALRGACLKYFVPNGQKYTVVRVNADAVVNVPKIRVCHETQFARAGVDRTKDLHRYNEDARRFLHSLLLDSITTKDLDPHPIPSFDRWMTMKDASEVGERDCQRLFVLVESQCKSSLAKGFCTLFLTPLAEKQLRELHFEDFLLHRRAMDSCYRDFGETPQFYCCRLTKAWDWAHNFEQLNLTRYLEDAKFDPKDILVSHNAVSVSDVLTWSSKYGPCYMFDFKVGQNQLKNTESGDVVLELVLNAFDYDSVTDQGMAVFITPDGSTLNDISVEGGLEMEVDFQSIMKIQDYDCSVNYPSLCSDLNVPYAESTCSECLKSRANCKCNNPLKRSNNIGHVAGHVCSLLEAIQCDILGEAQLRRSHVELCPEQCATTSIEMTKSTARLSAAYLRSLENDAVRHYVVNRVNDMIVAIDRTHVRFEAANQPLWESVSILTELLDPYFVFFYKCLQLAHGQPDLGSRNLSDFASLFTVQQSKGGAVDRFLQEYFAFVRDFSLPLSTVDESEKRDVVLVRSFEVQFLLGTPVNVPALVNFYRNGNFFDERLLSMLERLRTLLEAAIADAGVSSVHTQLLKDIQSTALFSPHTNSSTTGNAYLNQLRSFLTQYSRFLVSDFAKNNFVRLTLSIGNSKIINIDYHDSYNFWNFLSDVGGMLGLTFGLTIITLYEMMAFTFIDREPSEAHTRKEKKLTRKTLYPRAVIADEPIPWIY